MLLIVIYFCFHQHFGSCYSKARTCQESYAACLPDWPTDTNYLKVDTLVLWMPIMWQSNKKQLPNITGCMCHDQEMMGSIWKGRYPTGLNLHLLLVVVLAHQLSSSSGTYYYYFFCKQLSRKKSDILPEHWFKWPLFFYFSTVLQSFFPTYCTNQFKVS